MLRLPPFTYLAPQSIAEAVRLKAEHGADAMFVAGGSDVYAGMKRGQFEPKVLVALHAIEGLASVAGDAARGFSIGACVTLARLHEHPQIRAYFPALAEAAAPGDRVRDEEGRRYRPQPQRMRRAPRPRCRPPEASAPRPGCKCAPRRPPG